MNDLSAIMNSSLPLVGHKILFNALNVLFFNVLQCTIFLVFFSGKAKCINY